MISRKNSGRQGEQGVALITVLILLLLMTALSVGLAYLVTTQKSLSGGDAQTNTAFYSTEAGIENMTVQLGNLYSRQQSPTTATITGLGSNPPAIPGVTWKEYVFSVPTDANGNPATYVGTVPNDSQGLGGLSAAIIPITLKATAQLDDGIIGGSATKLPTQVRMMRKVEIALIPVFQFGVFSDMDLSYFAGPNFSFAGRVHTNGNLFLAGKANTIFNDVITVAQKTGATAGTSADNQIFRDVLSNFNSASGNGYTGSVMIPSAPSGCSSNGTTWPTSPTSTCPAISMSQGTVSNTTGSYNATTGISWTATLYGGGATSNPAWDNAVGQGIFNGMIKRDTARLVLPFINGSTNSATDPLPIEIIRRPPTGEDPTSNLGSSRLYNEASIRIILDDDPSKLNPTLAWNDPDNIPLQGTYNWNTDSKFKYGFLHLVNSVTGADLYYPLATGTTSNNVWQYGSGTYQQDYSWSYPAVDPYSTGSSGYSTTSPQPSWTTIGALSGAITTSDQDNENPKKAAKDWPLLSGWIRVEVRLANGSWQGVTREWLKFGFTRSTAIADSEHGVTYPNADGTAPILYLQELADRNANGTYCYTATSCAAAKSATNQTAGTVAIPWGGGNWPKYQPYSYYPINMYDAREGEVRDTSTSTSAGNDSCAINGVMNIVELDVGNLRKWLLGNFGSTGSSVDNSVSNGYILYYSDRRGLVDKVTHTDGGYDYLDTINDTVTSGAPNKTLDPSENVYSTPENPSGNFGLLTTGSSGDIMTPPKFIGAGFNYTPAQIAADTMTVYHRIECLWNSSDKPTPATGTYWTSTLQGAGRSNIVLGPRHALRLVDATLGNVPTKSSGGGGFTVSSEQPVYVFANYNASDAGWGTTSAPSAVIADAVTLESKSWSDLADFTNPAVLITASGVKKATSTWYRLAIAAGKNHTFLHTSYGAVDYGTDGGVHNFLRFNEDWSGITLNYEGSLVSLFYSAYGTGAFKCCTVVYSAPGRAYMFDENFTNPSLMPPGTPHFMQVINTAYRQDTTPKASN